MAGEADYMSFIYESVYEGEGLIGDPIHHYIVFTTPKKRNLKEITEKDIIDSDWVQRLRYIYQLQSSRWVYPSAEHSRFQHSVGTMHLASKFIQRLYPSLRKAAEDTPSYPLVEETLRITALLHDIGHGPFGHFFEENYLFKYKVTHEDLSAKIIIDELAYLIKKIKRSPSGEFNANESVNPEYCAFLIDKNKKKKNYKLSAFPKWIRMLNPLFTGVYTLDNIDYVLRDSYMCGVAIGPVDIDRLLYYTFFSHKGLTLHTGGASALTMFLIARLYLYTNVYFHRTTRAIDIQLKEVFASTIDQFNIGNPILNIKQYFKFTDWFILEEIKKWKNSSNPTKANLYIAWENILKRKIEWKMAFDETLSLNPSFGIDSKFNAKDFENKIKHSLPPHLKNIPFYVDYAAQDGRPINPINMGNTQIYIFNPNTKEISKEPLNKLFEYIPARVIKCRVFCKSYKYIKELHKAAQLAFKELS